MLPATPVTLPVSSTTTTWTSSFLPDLSPANSDVPGLSAIEMEGAAFAQVASQEKISWLVVRVISDNADDLAAQNFNQFLSEYKFESNNLLKVLIENYENAPWELNH